MDIYRIVIPYLSLIWPAKTKELPTPGIYSRLSRPLCWAGQLRSKINLSLSNEYAYVVS